MHEPNRSVSVIIPCRNERSHIEQFLLCLREQDLHGLNVEFLIAEGRSNDGTREVIENWIRLHSEFKLIDNPEGFVPTGLNRAIQAARGEIIVRMDVHSDYASDYLQACVRTLKETEADNVGGPSRTRAHGYMQEANALAFNSPFSCGGSRFHDVTYEGEVDTVTCGCWEKTTLERLGLFDEELIRNQDDELNLRLCRAGGRVWQTPAIKVWYYPRSSLFATFRQYAQYGYWKVRVIQKHKLPASFRHLVPGLFVFSLVGGSLGSLWSSLCLLLNLALMAIYLGGLLISSAWICRRITHWKYLPVMPAFLASYHMGYGYGFLRGVIDFVLLRRRPARNYTQLTRTSSPVSLSGQVGD